MNCTQIFVLLLLFTLALCGATKSAANKCEQTFDQAFKSISSYYKAILENCEQISALRKRRAEAASQEEYEILSSDTFLGCFSLHQCNRLGDREALSCLQNQTWQNFQMFNKVSYKANRLPVELQNTIRLIDDERFHCTNETADQLHLETQEAVAELIKCSEPFM